MHRNTKLSPCRVAICLLGLMLVGCAEPEPAAQEKPKKESIIGRTTQDIGEAQAGAQQADLQVKPESGLLAPLGSYGFAVSEVAKIKIKQSVELYKAEKGYYPKTHEAFMKDIIERNNIQLPVLPGGRRYQYDVDKHELIVVEAPAKTP